MNKYLLLLLAILLFCLTACTNENVTTEYSIQSFDAESIIELETSNTTEETANLHIKHKIFKYNDTNVALVYVSNKSRDAYSITIKGSYLDANGKIIKTETQVFEQLSGEYQNYMCFEPGIAFSDFTYELTYTRYDGPEYAKHISFRLKEWEERPTVIEEEAKKGNVKLFPSLVAYFNYANSGKQLVKGTVKWLIINEKEEIVCIFTYYPIMDPGLTFERGRKAWPVYQTTNDELILPEKFQGNLTAIGCLIDIREYTYPK